jgi:hypothetical protein
VIVVCGGDGGGGGSGRGQVASLVNSLIPPLHTRPTEKIKINTEFVNIPIPTRPKKKG